ncbi:MAG: AAA family ATPase [candidate division KSB1 bacterium]|nr:AAA family ATPase [candidate division KSB1 bacterium]MDZ7301465.1 AAA family ATPase [candidate division KSB1 bacterium]MDZ7310867.1 AAA family ATPase [candidate division KSB1 bacterium]
MKLLEMTLTGFGCLRDAHFSFHPKTNIIFGPNEAGKSTLQHAIIALLYGFYDGPRALPREQELHERFFPWGVRQSAAEAAQTVIFASPTSALPLSTIPSENEMVRNGPETSPVLHEPKIVVAPPPESHASATLRSPEARILEAETMITALEDNDSDGKTVTARHGYRGSLKYALDTGQTFLIHRDFSSADVPTVLLDAVTGEDWLGRYRRGRHGKVDFMERQIGMSRQVFLATACLQQGALRPLAEREASAVSDAILRLLDSAGADHSAEQATERLDRKLRELGSDRSQKALLPQARLRLEDLRATYLLRLATQREVQSDIEKIDILKMELDELHGQLAALDRQIIQTQLALFEARLSRAQENDRQRAKLAEEIAALSPCQDFPVADQEVFFQLMHDYNHHDKLRTMHLDERTSLELQLMALSERSKTLQVPESLWNEFLFEDFLVLRSRWETTFQEIIDNENARHAISDALQKAGLSESELAGFAGLDWRQLEQYKMLEMRVKEDEAEVAAARAAYDRHQKDRERRQGFAAIASIVAIVALVMDLANRLFGNDKALGVILPICLVALALVIVLYVRWATRSRELGTWLLQVEDRYMENRQNLREVLSRYQVASIQELEQHRLQFEELSKVIKADKDIKEKMNKIEQPLSNWMTAIGIGHIAPETLQDAEKRLRESYHLWSDKNTAQQRLAQIEEKIKQIEINLAELSGKLEAILRKAGITEPVGEKAFQSFLAGCQKREYLGNLQMQLQQAEALGDEILEGETPAAINEAIARLREELRTFDAGTEAAMSAGSDGSAKKSPPAVNEISRVELQRQREKLQEEIHAKEQTLAVLQERVEARLQGLPPLAEIEEDIALVEAEVNSLENARHALELARDFISQAAQRLHHDFAPRLNKFLGRYLDQLTNGRYRSAMVDPTDFSVRLHGPAVSSPTILTKLSVGTIEQVYLLLRAGVVEIFAESGESIPLMLDDPLVHADTKRMTNALQILDLLAESHQIFYFTKDPLILEHFRGKPEQSTIITLTAG